MGYITKTIKAIFGKSESDELVIDEQKLSPEDRKLLEIMRRDDNTEKLENGFVQSLNAKTKIKPITRKNTERTNENVKSQKVKNDEKSDESDERDER